MIVIVQHKVRDYETWKSVFDEHEATRRRHGATGHGAARPCTVPGERPPGVGQRFQPMPDLERQRGLEQRFGGGIGGERRARERAEQRREHRRRC